jgi:hypothetical protein
MGSGRLRPMCAVYLTRDAARRQVLAHFLRKRRAELGLIRLQLDDRAGLSWGALAEYERSCQQTRSAVTLRALAGKELHLLDEFGFARCTVYESGVGSLMTIRYDRIVPALFAGAIGWHYGSANVGDGILGGVVLGFHDIGYHRELTGFLLYILLQHQVLQIEAEVGPHRKRSVH